MSCAIGLQTLGVFLGGIFLSFSTAAPASIVISAACVGVGALGEMASVWPLVAPALWNRADDAGRRTAFVACGGTIVVASLLLLCVLAIDGPGSTNDATLLGWVAAATHLIRFEATLCVLRRYAHELRNRRLYHLLGAMQWIIPSTVTLAACAAFVTVLTGLSGLLLGFGMLVPFALHAFTIDQFRFALEEPMPHSPAPGGGEPG